ncbi:unnamed protein product [Rotaria sordida]|uniref:Uncharacterized protein n=1 Tax=Rotaria sordida TaxID=392033 RepID=A0A814T6K4_9BILA|nr:unnamed protein product [Rotaria sordida]CAF0890351.1 unnamed protein product [Rotaria sordida]CAF1135499.1 unnamed protein product [Rotaria sordida]CAF1154146.1 unnamed protein product [Rotaria sordida]CAF3768181.1 unnamed protein product [Rotaria sordida]
MQQVRLNRESIPEIVARERETAPTIIRTDLSSLLSEYTNTQLRYNDRLESLEREMTTLKSQIHPGVPSSDENELNRTFTIKKPPISHPTSARVTSPSRIPVPVTPRKLTNDDIPIVPTNNLPSTSRPLPPVPYARSKTFHNDTASASSNTSDEANLLRSYKVHLEQIRHKDVQPYSDIKIPNYTCIDDVIKANEQLLLENDRLRSELNRLKTESTLLLRSMKTATAIESNIGNERIIAERERQELTMELARQVEENKRLRKSLLAQSEKLLALHHSTNISNVNLSTSNNHRHTPESAPQSSSNSSRIPQPKSARYKLGNNRGFVRAKSFHHSSQDPS